MWLAHVFRLRFTLTCTRPRELDPQPNTGCDGPGAARKRRPGLLDRLNHHKAGDRNDSVRAAHLSVIGVTTSRD